MTEPATRLHLARGLLHAAAGRVMQACGWPAERAFLRPPARPATPLAFVGTPTLHQAPTAAARTVAATFPVWFVLDGAEEKQLEQLDTVLAAGWVELSAVRIGTEEGRATSVIVQSAGPEDVDTGGATARAVVFRVQATLLTATLCGQPMIDAQSV